MVEGGDEERIDSEMKGVWSYADSSRLCGYKPSGKCFMWASVAQPATVTLTRAHCAQKEYSSPLTPRPQYCSHQPLSLQALSL